MVHAVGDVHLSSAGSRLTIVMRGKIDQRLGGELRRSIDAWLEERGAPTEILLDLREVDDYDILGRAEPVTLHGALAKTGRRCAYVTQHARIRGLALLTIGEVGDRGSRAFATLEQGEAWLRLRDHAIEASIEQRGDPRRRP
jgi:anti-anti-sigma regulatory factor